MDNIKEWISDNLRYILLGLALILVLAVAVLGIKAISNIATGKKPAPSTEAMPQETESDTTRDVIVDSNQPSVTPSGGLTENDGKVLTTMTSYYNARTNGDTETLKKIDPTLDEQELASLTNSYVERYSDIKTYSKAGAASGDYVVYVCYNGKVKDIDTLVPSLTQYYLKSNADSSLYIYDYEADEQAKAFLEETYQTKEVQDLRDSVAKECEAAENSDPALKEFMSQYGNSQSSSSDGNEENTKSENTEMVANDQVYIRAEASTEAEILGGLYIGETVTKLGETDDGWTQIDFNGETAYVKSEYLSTPEEAQEESEADYFAPAAAEDDGYDENYDDSYDENAA